MCQYVVYDLHKDDLKLFGTKSGYVSKFEWYLLVKAIYNVLTTEDW